MGLLSQIWRYCLAQAGLLLLLLGCATAPFDPAAYQTAVQLKFETLALIDRASERYAAHKASAEALAGKYAAAYDAAAQLAGNQATAEQWLAIRDPQGASAGGVLQSWKQKGPLRPAVRAEKKRAVTRHFDRLICLEAGKQTASDCSEVGAVPETAASPGAAGPAAKPIPKPKPAEAAEPAADEPDDKPK
jgi:hypothetical protein